MSSDSEPRNTPPWKPGDPVSGSVTLDQLVAEVYPNISSDLGAISYDWSDYSTVIGTFPNAQSENAQSTAFIKIHFTSRAYDPSYIQPVAPS